MAAIANGRTVALHGIRCRHSAAGKGIVAARREMEMNKQEMTENGKQCRGDRVQKEAGRYSPNP